MELKNQIVWIQLLSLVEITAFRLESKSCKGFFFSNKYSSKESTRIYHHAQVMWCITQLILTHFKWKPHCKFFPYKKCRKTPCFIWYLIICTKILWGILIMLNPHKHYIYMSLTGNTYRHFPIRFDFITTFSHSLIHFPYN